MSADLSLLDTPKRITLQTQSIHIRAALKDFERTFAANNDGRKPSKDDIKADTDIAAKYKEYSKIRDVLSGKLDYAVLAAVPKSPTKLRKHERTDSGVSWSPRRKSYDATPRKPTRVSDLDPYDVNRSSSPNPVLLHAIGPTPQRDGRVLGLFDLLSNSAHSSRATPSNRKRKVDALIEESPGKIEGTAMAQTPSVKRIHAMGDILEHLTGTPETGHRKHSRTPASEGKKFMLSQFFATPSTARFSNVNPNLTKDRTPLRDRVLGATPDNRAPPLQVAQDTTPAYLRRSTSFKDRLLSSRNSDNNIFNTTNLPNTTTGPPTLKHLRSVQRSFDDLQSIFSDIEEEDEDKEEEHEDEWDALREMEDSQVNVLVKDSQQQENKMSSRATGGNENDTQHLQKIWKKRGQKRTTRRAVMRPTQGPLPKAPKFVAADNASDDEDISRIGETQANEEPGATELTDIDHLIDDEYQSYEEQSDAEHEQDTKPKTVKQSKVKDGYNKDKSKKAATINPNAVSHMNFRTLKIKNKNSKAKGRGKFGRGRR